MDYRRGSRHSRGRVQRDANKKNQKTTNQQTKEREQQMKAKTYADTLSALMQVKYGHTYNLSPLTDQNIDGACGLAGDQQEARNFDEGKQEPTVRVFAFVGESGEITETAAGYSENYEQLLAQSMHNMPLGTRAVGVWANSTMRTIPRELEDDLRAGGNPDQPLMAAYIREHGKPLDVHTVLVCGTDAQYMNLHFQHGTLSESSGGDDDAIGGRVADGLRHLYAFTIMQAGVEKRVREQVAAEQANTPEGQAEAAERDLWREFLAQDQNGDTNPEN